MKLRKNYGPGNKDGDSGINNALPKPTGPQDPQGGGAADEEQINLNDWDFSVGGKKKRKGIAGAISNSKVARFMSDRAGLVSDVYGAAMGTGSFFDIQSPKDKKIQELLNSDKEEDRKKGEEMAKKRDEKKAKNEKKFENITGFSANEAKAFGKTFEELGGFQEMYKGFNEIRDTMFVNGAPQDWKNTAKEMDENQKRKDDSKAYNFTHDEGNRQFIIKAMNLEAKAAAKYPGDPSKQTDWIDSKVEKELSQLAQDFLPLGVKDVALAYQLNQDVKKNGYTPLQAYSNYAKSFGAFNNNINIVNQVNNTTGGSYSNVSQAVPNAKDFWDNGYRDINRMQDAQMIKDKLETSVDLAMKLEQALRNKGKVSYNGTDPKVEAKFREINKYYEDMRKNKK